MSTNNIDRAGTKPAKEILPLLETCDYMDFDGNRVKMRSHRYKCFSKSGLDCVVCGIEGSIFAIEKHSNLNKSKEAQKQTWYHFNLYGLSPEGEEVLMTKDHILPKSKGGKNSVDNYQTMCVHCNGAKGDTLEEKHNG
jgi:hypothetical protein